jgi:Flp pilus assembly pilin Flp
MQPAAFQTSPRKKLRSDSPRRQWLRDDQGIAMILVLIALTLITAFSSYMIVTSVEDLKTSDNSESMIQARFAAKAGIDHARELLRGANFDGVLQGPDGAYDGSTAHLEAARQFSYRNLLSWSALRPLDILDPTSAVSSLADDGLLSTATPGHPGTVLVDKAGIAFTAANPYGSGTITTARYFLKASDNNGETSEVAKDTANNPYLDGDGIIIVRSIGIARTLAESSGSSLRRNSVAIFEARFQNQSNPFDNLGSPAVVVGNDIAANFSGNAFSIIGNGDGPGIATIDTNPNDAIHPAAILKTATNNKGSVTGNCTGADQNNCIVDITSGLSPSKKRLSDPVWMYDFVFTQVPLMADNTITNGRVGTANLGTAANPKVTFVNGDLDATGGITGAGLLVVTGELQMGGSIQFDGLVLVIGTGSFWAHGMNRGIHGGLVVANLMLVNGVPTFGRSQTTLDFDIRGNSDIVTYDGSLSSAGSGLLSARQLSFREVTSSLDP